VNKNAESLDDVLNSMRATLSHLNLGYKYPEKFWIHILESWINEVDMVVYNMKETKDDTN
jgi:uncharacterized protein Yka (UPF0111/DUF47 family)